MADISIQFHALPVEVALFAEEIARDLQLYVLAMRYSPFDLREISNGKVVHFREEHPAYKRYAFTLTKPVLPVTDELDFSRKNPDYLRLDIGRIVENGLEQSWLTARTNNPQALVAWRKVAARLKRMTKQGATATDPKTGASSRLRSFRYTAKAEAEESRGLVMLPPAGTSHLKLG